MSTISPLISFSHELKSLIETIGSLSGKVVNAARRHKAGKAAASLDGLHFGPGGFRRALLKIAKGGSPDAEIDALDHFYRETGPAVAEDMISLRSYHDALRKLCGAEVSAKLDEVLGGENGKFVIRYEIDGLVQMARGGRCSPADLQQRALKILAMIEEFNADLIELHDTIFPPVGAPKALI